MVSLEVIEREIDELEHRQASFKTCERLSVLYIVRDHLLPTVQDERTRRLEGSEFLDACSGVSFPALMEVLNEHVQTLALVQPKAYEGLMRKIRNLS